MSGPLTSLEPLRVDPATGNIYPLQAGANPLNLPYDTLCGGESLGVSTQLSVQQTDSVGFLAPLTDSSAVLARFSFTSGGMSGKIGWAPGPGYTALAYVRDFAMAVRGRPEIVSASELLDLINAHFAAHGVSGQIYDAIGVDSAAYSAVTSTPFPCYDNIFYLIDLCYSHYLKTGLTTAYTTNQTALGNALAYVPVTNHLVFITDNGTLANIRNGWGFQDQVASSGYELMCSVLRYRSYVQLTAMATATGQTSNVAAYSTEAGSITSNLETQLWDSGVGWFKNASIKNPQHNVMGSAFAVLQGCVTSTVKDAIIANLISGRPGNAHALAGKGFYDHGMIRHLPLDENWTSVRPGAGASGRFQNGGYWPVATGWVCKVLAQNGYLAEADKIMGEYVAYCRTLSPVSVPLEWANTSGPYEGSTKYLVSSALPLEFYRGKVLRDYPVALPGVFTVKSTVTLAMMQAGGAVDEEDFLIATLPARSVVLNTVVKHSAAVTGGAMSAVTAQIQTANNNYGTAFNVFQAPGATVRDFYATQKLENFATTTEANLHLGFTGGSADNLSAGSIDSWITYMILP